MMEMKDLEGKEVWLEPTGNAARRWDGKPQKAKIEKVARVFTHLRFDGFGFSNKFRVTNMHISDDFNSGYNVYTSEAAFVDKLCVDDIAEKISSQYRNRSSYAKLDKETIVKVASLLGIEH